MIILRCICPKPEPHHLGFAISPSCPVHAQEGFTIDMVATPFSICRDLGVIGPPIGPALISARKKPNVT